MTSIAERKHVLKKALREIVMDAYYTATPEQRIALLDTLLSRFMSRLTLRELHAWHQAKTHEEKGK